MSEKYKPINCDLHDHYLEYATFKKPVTITYMDEEEKKELSGVTIIDVYTTKKEEFMKLSNGTVIRLDRISSVEVIE